MNKVLLILTIFSFVQANGMDGDMVLQETSSIIMQNIVIEAYPQEKRSCCAGACSRKQVKKIALSCGVPACILLSTLVVVVWSIWG